MPGLPPLYERLTDAEMDKIVSNIAGGVYTVEDGFMAVTLVSRRGVWRCMARGNELDERVNEGEHLTEEEERGHRFYLRVLQAQAKARHSLMKAAQGLEWVGNRWVRNVKTESANALRLLLLVTPSLRTPERDSLELDAMAAEARAKAGMATAAVGVSVPEMTRAQVEAEAAKYGLRVVSVDVEAAEAELRATKQAQGVAVASADGDEYDASTAADGNEGGVG